MTSSPHQDRWLGFAVFVVCLLVYGLTTFGAVRSPDSEVVFEVCEALADHGTFAVAGTSSWHGFGLAPGRDGRQYSVFGVGQSLACVPVLWAGRALGIAGDGAPARINPSYYVDAGLLKFIDGKPIGAHAPHGDRFVASYLNVLAGALGAWLFYAIARRLVRHPAAALAVTGLYAFGTLAWSYSGFCFSEPLAIVFVLLSLLLLMRAGAVAPLGAGLALGYAVATHVTAILFAPFFAAYAYFGAAPPARRRAALAFCAGLGVLLLLIGLYNELRFGSPLETGRTVDLALADSFDYGHAVAPWDGLHGLSIGLGNGLILFVPAVIGGALLLPGFMRRNPALGWMIALASATRVLFIAARSDWHGGFSLGPRLLLMIVPLLLLPIVPWLDRALDERRRGALVAFAVASWLCVTEQIAFVVGEPFLFYRQVAVELARGAKVFVGGSLIPEPGYNVLTTVMRGPRGPWLLRDVPLSNFELWLVLSACAAGLWALAAWGLLSRRSPAPAAPAPSALHRSPRS